MTESKIQEAVIEKVQDKNNYLSFDFKVPENENWMMLCENKEFKKFIERYKNETDICSAFRRIRHNINFFLNLDIPFCSEQYNEEEKEKYKEQLKMFLIELNYEIKVLNLEMNKPNFQKRKH